MRKYLIVANQPLTGTGLRDRLHACLDEGACAFHVVAPASPPLEPLVYTDGESQEVARDRLAQTIAWLRARGARATGEVGDPDPVLAINDALRQGDYDEIIVSTPAPGLSRWLGADLPSRVDRRTDLPVTVVENGRNASTRPGSGRS